VIEGPGSGSIPLTNGPGSRWSKHMWIRWIRIRNTAVDNEVYIRMRVYELTCKRMV